MLDVRRERARRTGGGSCRFRWRCYGELSDGLRCHVMPAASRPVHVSCLISVGGIRSRSRNLHARRSRSCRRRNGKTDGSSSDESDDGAPAATPVKRRPTMVQVIC